MELRDRAGVAGLAPAAADDDGLVEDRGQFGVAVEGGRERCERSEIDDRDLAGVLAGEFAEDLVGRVERVPRRALERDTSQAAGAVEGDPVALVFCRQRRGELGPLWRVDLVDERVDVGGCLLGGDIAGRGKHADDIEFGIVEGECDRKRGVDPRVGDDDDLSRHADWYSCFRRRAKPPPGGGR